jgi:hypothetical protein
MSTAKDIKMVEIIHQYWETYFTRLVSFLKNTKNEISTQEMEIEVNVNIDEFTFADVGSFDVDSLPLNAIILVFDLYLIVY